MRIAVLVYSDPTRDGVIRSELTYLNPLLEGVDAQITFVVVGEYFKRWYLKRKDLFTFKHDFRAVTSLEEATGFDEFDAVVTYPGLNNTYGGVMSRTNVIGYAIISRITNSGGRAFVRLNDSELTFRDYKTFCAYKARTSEAFAPKNTELVGLLESVPKWDYSRVHWLANGTKSKCDWVANTVSTRVPPTQKFVDEATAAANAIYVSDDVFFSVHAKAKSMGLAPKPDPDPRLFFVGFFDNINTKRADTVRKIVGPGNPNGLSMVIRGKGTELLSDVAALPGMEVREEVTQGDVPEFYSELNGYLAYVFIGKGNKVTKYVGKTVYDCVIAGVPVACYAGCDSLGIAFANREYYFSNGAGLAAIQERLLDPATRARWVREQREDIEVHLEDNRAEFRAALEGKHAKAEV
jgi:hypothetical protein